MNIMTTKDNLHGSTAEKRTSDDPRTKSLLLKEDDPGQKRRF
jgi:hypothetical protein